MILAALNAGSSPLALNIHKSSSLDDIRDESIDSSGIGTYSLTHSLTHPLACSLTCPLTHLRVTGGPHLEDDVGRQSTLLLPTSALDENRYNVDEESEYLENYEMYGGRDSSRILGN